MNEQQSTKMMWGIGVISALLPIIAWGSYYSWDLANLTAFQWFPLFGLLAWMIMCTHFFTVIISKRYPDFKSPKSYSKVSEWVVLACLIAHPTILTIKLTDIGAGSPPNSWVDYAGESLGLVVLAGSIALWIFLSFELLNRLKNNKKIQKNWHIINITQALAMVLVFVHAIRLGSIATTGWFGAVWVAYGILLLPSFYLMFKSDYSKQ